MTDSTKIWRKFRGAGHGNCYDNAQDFEKSIQGYSTGERVARIKDTLKDVASKNGWQKDAKISKVNGRDVYKDKKKEYWSIDTEKGRFEKADKRGKHLGEFDIDGNQTGKPDTKGRHDLKI
ncbi:colicin E3/pyocin S6 family cytotoxin [Agrobacterium vitis]|uniref:colicin E3/pyocin S6 family cytotoxin n=1 Tax=Agrobacterium vitis TaxID=373 RepID=UPI003D2852EF